VRKRWGSLEGDYEVTHLWDVMPGTLKMEATSSSKTLVTSIKLHGVPS
jgi:hypothetical protein